ncbi:MAG: GGDEF domain-containing protein [Ilumatobacter sp.]|nr:GGDEF domain-containing protein [Ilumatobacter sp.]
MTDEPLLDDSPFWLSALEHRAIRSVSRHGIRQFVLSQAALAIVVSVLLVVASWWILDDFRDAGSWGLALVLAALVPAIVAPPLIAFCARLIARLESARQLLRTSSVTDPLTGVANRRGFFETFDDTVAVTGFDSVGVVEPSIVGMVDIDAFKSLNDRYGHGFGDRALVHVADWLRSVVGESGLVGRLGGDEFAFVAAAERCRSLPSRRQFVLGGVTFSASIGLAREAGATTPSALHEADVALYRIKRERHNVELI